MAKSRTILSGPLPDLSPTWGPGWRLIKSLPIDIVRDEDGQYIVSDSEFLIYGNGETLDVATIDYMTSLLEYYDLLVHSTNPYDRADLHRLQSYLQPPFFWDAAWATSIVRSSRPS